MSDSSFHLAKFSPLKTPDIGKYRKTRDDDYVSSSSIASSVTNDIIRLSQDVKKKLKSDRKRRFSASSTEKGPRGNIFLTQRFPEMPNKKPKGSSNLKKKSKSSSKSPKSGSAASDIASGSEPSDSDEAENVFKNKKLKKKVDVGKSAKEGKTRKASTSSASSDSDSSSEMDQARLQEIAEKIRAKTSQTNDSDSSESKDESDGTPEGVEVSERQQVENDEFVNFSQDLFSQATRHSDSDSERKVSRKSKTVIEGQHKENTGTVRIIKKMFGTSLSKQFKSKSKTNKNHKDIPHKHGKSDNKSIGIQQRKRSASNLSLPEAESESDISTGKGKAMKKGISKMGKTTSQSSCSDADTDNASETNAITNAKQTVDFSDREDSNSDADSDNGVSSSFNSSKSDSDSEVPVEKTSRKVKIDSPKSSTPNKKSKKSKTSDMEENEPKQHSSKTQGLNRSKSSNHQGSAIKDNMKSPDSHKQTMRQSKITDHCSPAAGSSGKQISKAKKRQLRYQAPVGFETQDAIDKYVTESEIQGKQLWLIQTPVDFDIQTLNDKTVKLDGQPIICDNEESEKQYEVMFRLYQDSKGPGYSTVVVGDKGNYKLGERLCGQIQVMDWVPGIPPVTMEIQSPRKHEVPDNLKKRYVPYGAGSPKRVETTDLQDRKRKHERGHSEGKKKKKKERKTLHDL